MSLRRQCGIAAYIKAGLRIKSGENARRANGKNTLLRNVLDVRYNIVIPWRRAIPSSLKNASMPPGRRRSGREIDRFAHRIDERIRGGFGEQHFLCPKVAISSRA